MLSLLMLAETLAQRLPLDRIGNIHVGDSKAMVQQAWSDLGPIKESTDKDGVVELKAGVMSASFCQGRVIRVSREFGKTFNEFATFAGFVVQAHGPAGSPEVFSANYKRPATDPKGEFVLMTAVVRLRWDKAPGYMLQYYEVNGETHAMESVSGPNPCKPK